ncbi:MAG: Uma2 family endonuclease [Prochlorothrix sp.]|nr:Uma2 family endonuclease [Prochlorothrix sp.]
MPHLTLSVSPLDPALASPVTWTDEAFMALAEDGQRYEVINDRLVTVGNSGALHGQIAIIFSSALFAIVNAQKLGVVFDSSTAFKMKSGNKRAPDISFMAKARLEGLSAIPTGFLEGAPDLCVEILSPGNTVEEMDAKLQEYFANGARLVWVISPTQRYVLVYRSAVEPDRLLKCTDTLDGEAVVPGFTLPIGQLFPLLEF